MKEEQEIIKNFLMFCIENDYLSFDELEYKGEEINTSECVADKLINRYISEQIK